MSTNFRLTGSSCLHQPKMPLMTTLYSASPFNYTTMAEGSELYRVVL